MRIVESHSPFNSLKSPLIEGDRFISIRGCEDQEGAPASSRFEIKTNLFEIDDRDCLQANQSVNDSQR